MLMVNKTLTILIPLKDWLNLSLHFQFISDIIIKIINNVVHNYLKLYRICHDRLNQSFNVITIIDLLLIISMKKMVQKDNYCVHIDYNISNHIVENVQVLFF